MKLTLFDHQIPYLDKIPAEFRGSILFESEYLSRRGDKGLINYDHVKKARALGFKSILVVDSLVTPNEFDAVVSKLSSFNLSLFDRVRVADEGLLNYLLKTTSVDIEISLENGSHNLEALLGWINLAPGRIKKLVLSLQITKDRLSEVIPKIDVETEILGIGPISIFYSPRKLLSPLFGAKESHFVKGTSEESPHKGFLITESPVGTTMYHIKDISLLSLWSQLESIGVSSLRLDLFHVNDEVITEALYQGKLDEVERLWPREKTKGLFITNKSDVLFKKLKNENLKRIDGEYLGRVISSDRDEGLVILAEKSIVSGSPLTFRTPEGKEITGKGVELFSLENNHLLEASPASYFSYPYVKGVTPKSIVIQKILI